MNFFTRLFHRSECCTQDRHVMMPTLLEWREDTRPEAWVLVEIDGERCWQNIRWAWQQTERCACDTLFVTRWRDDMRIETRALPGGSEAVR